MALPSQQLPSPADPIQFRAKGGAGTALGAE